MSGHEHANMRLFRKQTLSMLVPAYLNNYHTDIIKLRSIFFLYIRELCS